MTHGGNVWEGNSPSQWLDYSANIRPGGAPEWVMAALGEGMRDVSYYPDPQMKRAGASMARYLETGPEFVRPTAGGISAIDMAAHLDAAGMVILTPCFAEYAFQCANWAKSTRKVSLLRARHCPGDPAEMVESALFEGCAVWLCNPLNPVGNAYSRVQIQGLLKRVEEVHGWLIIDEAFIEYCRQHSSVDLVGMYERLLITGSLTKILGIPGVRLGYLCGQPQVLASLDRYQLNWELNCFAGAVACALPWHKGEIQAEARANALRRERMRADLEAMGVFVYPSEASFLLADFGRPVSFIARRLKERKILVRTCMNFDGIDDGRHLRLAVKDDASNRRLMDALREEITCAENH